MNKINFSCSSITGLVRKNNEDNFYCDGKILTQQEIFSLNGIAKTPCIFAVCDGMGGEANGELASLTVVKILSKYAEKIKSSVLHYKNVDDPVQVFISAANKVICDIMRENSFRMGTTLAFAVISDDFVRAYNIGDSRIYKFQNGILSRISEDHTVAAQKIKMGLLTPESARHDKTRHILTRCLGVFEEEMILTPNIIPPVLTKDASNLLICSDGLTDMLSDSQIQDILSKNKDAHSAVYNLVQAALKNGGRDNITCIVIKFQDQDKGDLN